MVAGESVVFVRPGIGVFHVRRCLTGVIMSREMSPRAMKRFANLASGGNVGVFRKSVIGFCSGLGGLRFNNVINFGGNSFIVAGSCVARCH